MFYISIDLAVWAFDIFGSLESDTSDSFSKRPNLASQIWLNILIYCCRSVCGSSYGTPEIIPALMLRSPWASDFSVVASLNCEVFHHEYIQEKFEFALKCLLSRSSLSQSFLLCCHSKVMFSKIEVFCSKSFWLWFVKSLLTAAPLPLNSLCVSMNLDFVVD